MSGIHFDSTICGNPEDALEREWLETNGIGGFASSTISGANTRRYHGLLVAAIEPIVRALLLSKLEETLIVDGQRFELSTNLYPGVTYPEGFRFQTSFRVDPFPVFTFAAAGVIIEKRLFLVDSENTVVVEYAIMSGPACTLELRPLIAFRGYHELTHENPALNNTVEQNEGTLSIRPYADFPSLNFAHNAAAVNPGGEWYRNFEYPLERERGLSFVEDLYCPFALAFDLSPDKPASIIASTSARNISDAGALKASELERRGQLTGTLAAAAGQFIVRRGDLHTVVAGYPWFTDWGRDTMIGLPGLTLATGRFNIARDILLEFASLADEGMLPNSFPDKNQPPAYNTVDASLWFFEAVRQYLDASGDLTFVRAQLYRVLTQIIEWHLKGTRYGIHMDSAGLIDAGEPTTQLTWMDARVGDRPVTPRNGKAVEIQALWYNALRFMQRLAYEFGDENTSTFYTSLATKTGKNFNAQFWNESAGCLFDVVTTEVNGERRDASVRPNQLIALSLGYCAIPEARARRVIATVESNLLTPFGLRTLAPTDAAYVGRYEGPPEQRDAAYHQGTVWPWLMGPFIAANVRFNGDAARTRIPGLLAPLLQFAESRGTGQIAEIFDGDAPHEPRGCFAQAWSVGEILRASVLANL